MSIHLKNITNFIVFLIQNLRLYIISTFIGFIVGVLISFLIPEKYTAIGRLIVKEKSSNFSQLSGIANLIGLNLNSESSLKIMLPDIIYSDTLLNQIISYNYKSKNDQTSLLNYFDIENDSQNLFEQLKSFQVLKKILREQIIKIVSSPENNVVEIKISLSDPILAADLVNRLIKNTNEFVSNQNVYNSNVELHFISSRVNEIQSSINEIEAEIIKLEKTNTNWQSVPEFNYRWKQLNRDLQFNINILDELNRQNEIYKIEILRQREYLEILDFAETPTIKTSIRKVFIIFGVVSIFLLLSFFYLKNKNEIKETYQNIVSSRPI